MTLSGDPAIVNLTPSRKIWHNGALDGGDGLQGGREGGPSHLFGGEEQMTEYCAKSIATGVLSNVPTFLREQFEIDIFRLGAMTGWKSFIVKYHFN